MGSTPGKAARGGQADLGSIPSRSTQYPKSTNRKAVPSMTALAGGVSYPVAKFPAVGSTVKGVVIDAQDVQERDFNTKQPKFWPDGNPVMSTRVTLEQPDGSRISLYISGKRMLRAVREAIKGAGHDDIQQYATLSVTFTGKEPNERGQMANCYSATYEAFDPSQQAA